MFTSVPPSGVPIQAMFNHKTMHSEIPWRATARDRCCTDITRNLSGLPWIFRVPHWKSIGLPEISRVNWQLLCINTDKTSGIRACVKFIDGYMCHHAPKYRSNTRSGLINLQYHKNPVQIWMFSFSEIPLKFQRAWRVWQRVGVILCFVVFWYRSILCLSIIWLSSYNHPTTKGVSLKNMAIWT